MLAVVVLGLGPQWLGVLLLVWAPLVGLARVAMGVHYLSDVLAGMVLGLAIGVLLLFVINAEVIPIQLMVNHTQFSHLLAGMV